jgi:RHS repeat-associated protein
MFGGDSTQDVIAGMYDTPNRELQGSQQGRWLSPDPAGAGWNQYAYATNPNSAIDPTGLGEQDHCGHWCYSTPDAHSGTPNYNPAFGMFSAEIENFGFYVWVTVNVGSTGGTVAADSGSGSQSGSGSTQLEEDPAVLQADLIALAGPSAGPDADLTLYDEWFEQAFLNLMPASIVNLGQVGDTFNGWDSNNGQWAIENQFQLEVTNGFGTIYDYGTVTINEAVTSGAQTGYQTTSNGLVSDWMGYPLGPTGGPATDEETFPQIVSQQSFTATLNYGAAGSVTYPLSTVFQNTYSLTNGVLTTSKTTIVP